MKKSSETKLISNINPDIYFLKFDPRKKKKNIIKQYSTITKIIIIFFILNIFFLLKYFIFKSLIKKKIIIYKESTNNNNNNIKNNNKGFLKINTTHKSIFTSYNYTDNIIVYKDLYNDIVYTPINERNTIIESTPISRDKYFELCDKKILLDNTKYKRSKNPKISIIIPYYNKNKFNLYVPLRSIQNQSFKDLEIVFVDDGSSEEKINEIFEEMKFDNRIILLKHKESKGTLMTRVDGVRYASGDYVLQLDQDDLHLTNLLLEKLYKKAKEFNLDIVQFTAVSCDEKNNYNNMTISIRKNEVITQPELKITFLTKLDKKRFGHCSTRMIWDKFVRREIYLEAINDLGDEYLNHKMFLYEDTLMMFELSQIAYSYYYYDIDGYRFNTYLRRKSRDGFSNYREILAMNQLYFIKLLLYKVDPMYDRYHIFKEWGFAKCGSEVTALNRNKDIDLLYEVLEVIFELERIYNNTCQELLNCANDIKKYFLIK